MSQQLSTAVATDTPAGEARWMDGHRIDWTIDYSTGVRSRIHCTGEEDAWCRLTCKDAMATGCEGWLYDEGRVCDCEKVDGGECWVAPYFDDWDEIPEAYAGPQDADVHSGPIQVRWEHVDETYEWRYPQP